MKSLVSITSFMILNIVCSKAFSQEILCVDTVQVIGYFYKMKYRNGVGILNDKSSKKYKAYFISKQSSQNLSIDSIFNRHYLSKDTVKYLSYVPSLPRFIENKMSIDCLKIIKEDLFADTIISPKNYFLVKSYYKFEKGSKIGFSFVNIKWLHLKIIDKIAFDYFNEPYSLDNPFTKSKYYNIFIPLKVISLNNNVIPNGKRRLD